MDFRSHKMAKGGLAACNTFRKHISVNAEKTKYPTIVRTAEEIENEPQEQDNEMYIDQESEEEQKKFKKSTKKNYTIDDIMQIDKIKISKKKGDAIVVP